MASGKTSIPPNPPAGKRRPARAVCACVVTGGTALPGCGHRLESRCHQPNATIQPQTALTGNRLPAQAQSPGVFIPSDKAAVQCNTAAEKPAGPCRGGVRPERGAPGQCRHRQRELVLAGRTGMAFLGARAALAPGLPHGSDCACDKLHALRFGGQLPALPPLTGEAPVPTSDTRNCRRRR